MEILEAGQADVLQVLLDHRCQLKLLYPINYVIIKGEKETTHNQNRFKELMSKISSSKEDIKRKL